MAASPSVQLSDHMMSQDQNDSVFSPTVDEDQMKHIEKVSRFSLRNLCRKGRGGGRGEGGKGGRGEGGKGGGGREDFGWRG